MPRESVNNPQEGVANGTWKILGHGKFWSDLKFSEAFVMSHKVSVLCLSFILESKIGLASVLGFQTKVSVSQRVLDFTICLPNKRLCSW